MEKYQNKDIYIYIYIYPEKIENIIYDQKLM